MAARLGNVLPMRRIMSPNLAHLLSQQTPAPPGSDPAKQETSPQTPGKPEE